jgi:hypothetical protein
VKNRLSLSIAMLGCTMLSGGCMATSAVDEIRHEESLTHPTSAYVGDDGSVVLVATALPKGRDKTAPGPTRYICFDRRAVEDACAIAAKGRTHERGSAPVLRLDAEGRAIVPLPISPPTLAGRVSILPERSTRSAEPDMLPDAAQRGRRIDFTASTTQPNDKDSGPVSLVYDWQGRTVILMPECKSIRIYSTPCDKLTRQALIVPAGIFDVITFPIQLMLIPKIGG